MKKALTATVAALVSAGAVTAQSTVSAQSTPTQPDGTTYEACYVPLAGAVYLIRLPGLLQECLLKNNDKHRHIPFTFNAKGVKGDQGPQGIQGPAGPRGEQGPAGVGQAELGQILGSIQALQNQVADLNAQNAALRADLQAARNETSARLNEVNAINQQQSNQLNSIGGLASQNASQINGLNSLTAQHTAQINGINSNVNQLVANDHSMSATLAQWWQALETWRGSHFLTQQGMQGNAHIRFD